MSRPCFRRFQIDFIGLFFRTRNISSIIPTFKTRDTGCKSSGTYLSNDKIVCSTVFEVHALYWSPKSVLNDVIATFVFVVFYSAFFFCRTVKWNYKWLKMILFNKKLIVCLVVYRFLLVIVPALMRLKMAE